MTTRFQFRRANASAWTASNPTLASGELGFELDTGKFKIGNGSSAWNSLAYAATNIIASYPIAYNSGTYVISLSYGTGLTLNGSNQLVPDFGTTSGKVAQGNDSRFTDARTPTAHASTHGSAGSDPVTLANTQITGLGTSSTKDVASTGDASSTQVVLGSDTRLTNARTPTAHKLSHSTGGTDALAPSDIGAVATSSLGTNVATFLSNPTSSNLAGAVTDETGTGALVFGSGPTIGLPIIDNPKLGYATTATAGGTTTLTSSSNYRQYFTGTTTQTVALPSTSTLALGQAYEIHNLSTGTITIQSFGANSIATLESGKSGLFTCVSTSLNTTAAWDTTFDGATTNTGTGALVFGTGPTLSQPLIDNPRLGYSTIVTAAGTTTLTATSSYRQFFTGTSTQTITLPVTSTLALGQSYEFHNLSTGTVTINASGGAGNTVDVLEGSKSVLVTCVLTSGTTASSWEATHIGATTDTGNGALVYATSPTITSPTIGSISEPIGTITATSGTIAYNYNTSTTFYHTSSPTSAGTGWIANLTNLPTTADRAYNFTIVVPQGATSSFISAVQIDGVSATVKWAGSTTTPTGNNAKTDIWVFTLFRVSGAWTVLGVLSANFG